VHWQNHGVTRTAKDENESQLTYSKFIVSTSVNWWHNYT